MKALRIKLRQNEAHYRRAETVINRMTYPLPPVSTVIGALHNACGFTEYHPMDISIQGKYEAMQREPYVNHAILNTVEGDRGILVKLNSPNTISAGYELVAKKQDAKRQNDQKDIFRKEINIDICNIRLLREYQSLKDKKEQLEQEKKETDAACAGLKLAKNTKKALQKKLEKNSEAYKALQAEIKELGDKEKAVREVREGFKIKRRNEYEIPYSYFAVLTKSLQYYEVLYGVELVLYVRTDENTLKCIEDNIYNFAALGRSEDFIELVSCNEVELQQKIEGEYYEEKGYMAYLDKALVTSETEEDECAVVFKKREDNYKANGTVYLIDKNYAIEEDKRKFTKKWVMCVEGYGIDEDSWKYGNAGDLYFDAENSQIVNFL